MDYVCSADILDEIAQLTPIYGGIDNDRLEKGGLQWPCWNREHPGTPILHKGQFTRGRGKFHDPFFMENFKHFVTDTHGPLFAFRYAYFVRKNAGALNLLLIVNSRFLNFCVCLCGSVAINKGASCY